VGQRAALGAIVEDIALPGARAVAVEDIALLVKWAVGVVGARALV